jgi:hypothetical protein
MLYRKCDAAVRSRQSECSLWRHLLPLVFLFERVVFIVEIRPLEKEKKLNLFLPSLLPSLPHTNTSKIKIKKQTASQLAPPPPAPRRRNAALGAPRSPKPKRQQQDEPVRRSGRLDGKPPWCYSEDPALPANREVRKLKGGSGSRSIRERGERGEFRGGGRWRTEKERREKERD